MLKNLGCTCFSSIYTHWKWMHFSTMQLRNHMLYYWIWALTCFMERKIWWKVTY